jgi:hypothetical protein
MTTNYQRTADFIKASGKEVGNHKHLDVQMGCFLEEIAEFLAEVIYFSDVKRDYAIGGAAHCLMILAKNLKKGSATAIIDHRRRAAALDALCDIEVTANGLAYLAGLNKPLADQRVLDSNDAKLVNGQPVILEGGKIGKPEGWMAPDLSDCI